MLAEVQLHLRRLARRGGHAAPASSSSRPGDADSYLALERVLVQEDKIAEAIAVLEKLVAGRPEARARALPAHGAVRAADLQGRRRHQVRGARRGAEPGRRRGAPAPRRDVPLQAGHRARHRRVSRGHREERPALRRLLRARGSAPRRRARPTRPTGSSGASSAARRTRSSSRGRRGCRCRSTSGKGTLESLEQELLPLAIGNPQRPHLPAAPRRDLRQPHVRPGAARAPRHGRRTRTTARARSRASGRARSSRCSTRSPTRTRASSASPSTCSAYVQNRNAALPLFAFATGSADTALRVARDGRVRRAARSGARAASTRRCSSRRTPASEARAGRRRRGGRGLGARAHRRRRRRCRSCGAWRSGGTPRDARARGARARARRTTARRSRDVARIATVGGRGQRGARGGGVRARRAGRARRRCPTLLEIAEESDALPRAAWRSWRSRAWRAAARKEPGVAARGRRRRWPTRCSPAATTSARARPRRESWRARRCGALAPLASVGRTRPTSRAAARGPARCPRARSTSTRCSTRSSRGTSPRPSAPRRSCGSPSRCSARRWPRCGPRATARARCSTRSGAATASSSRSSARSATGPAARRGAEAIARGARAEPRPAGASPRSGDARRRRSCSLARSRATPQREAVVAALEDANEAVQRVALAAIGRPGRRRAVPASARAVAAVGKILPRTRAGRCASSRRRRWAGSGGAGAGRRRARAPRGGDEGRRTRSCARRPSRRSRPSTGRGARARARRLATIPSRGCATPRARSPRASRRARSRLAADGARCCCAGVALRPLPLVACHDLSGFSTSGGSYQGAVVAARPSSSRASTRSTSLCLDPRHRPPAGRARAACPRATAASRDRPAPHPADLARPALDAQFGEGRVQEPHVRGDARARRTPTATANDVLRRRVAHAVGRRRGPSPPRRAAIAAADGGAEPAGQNVVRASSTSRAQPGRARSRHRVVVRRDGRGGRRRRRARAVATSCIQVELHAPYGGVVPELASRDHLRNVRPVVREALARAGVALARRRRRGGHEPPGPRRRAARRRAGRQGDRVGRGQAARGRRPPVGHLLSVFLRRGEGDAPSRRASRSCACSSSGGHTAIYRVDAPARRRRPRARRDARRRRGRGVRQGREAARPRLPGRARRSTGSPRKGDAVARDAARAPMASRGSLEMSFSGIKTQVAQLVARGRRCRRARGCSPTSARRSRRP